MIYRLTKTSISSPRRRRRVGNNINAEKSRCPDRDIGPMFVSGLIMHAFEPFSMVSGVRYEYERGPYHNRRRSSTSPKFSQGTTILISETNVKR